MRSKSNVRSNIIRMLLKGKHDSKQKQKKMPNFYQTFWSCTDTSLIEFNNKRENTRSVQADLSYVVMLKKMDRGQHLAPVTRLEEGDCV